MGSLDSYANAIIISMVAKKDVAFLFRSFAVKSTVGAAYSIVAKWLMLQIIMMISFFTLQKDCVVTFFTFLSVSIATFEEYYKKSRLAFAIWQKFCIVSKNLLEGKRS